MKTIMYSIALLFVYAISCIAILNCEKLNPLRTNRLLSTVHNVTAPPGVLDGGHD